MQEDMIQLRRLELIPTVFFISAFVLMCTLGTWQLQRLAWKKNILMETEKVQNLPALVSLPQDISDLTYRKVALTGEFLHDHTFHLIGRQQGVDMGFYMLTPLELKGDGRIILVNRGFSPLGKESKPEGLVRVEGSLRPVREKRYFVPENMPEKNVWTHEDLNKIGELIGKTPLPLIVEAIGTQQKDIFPIPSDGKVIFRNDHLGYAFTWYALALTSLVMFAVYYRKK